MTCGGATEQLLARRYGLSRPRATPSRGRNQGAPAGRRSGGWVPELVPGEGDAIELPPMLALRGTSRKRNWAIGEAGAAGDRG